MYQNDFEWIVLFWIKQVPCLHLPHRKSYWTEMEWKIPRSFIHTWSVSSYRKHLRHYFLLRTNCWIWELSAAIVVFTSNRYIHLKIFEVTRLNKFNFPFNWLYCVAFRTQPNQVNSLNTQLSDSLCHHCASVFFKLIIMLHVPTVEKSVAVWACNFFTRYVP